MRIKEINIKNFRQHQNTVLSFSNKGVFDFNYILGENGIGKTTLMNCFSWCLYGKELHTTEALRDKALPILTLKSLREMENGEERDAYVSITIEDLGGEVTFERTVTFRKTEEGDAYEKQKNQKVVLNPLTGNPVVLNSEEEFQTEVNRRLPERIQQFFFFDGEMLETYLESKSGLNVEKTVLEVSQIDLLITMQKNLSIISTEMRRNASKTNSKSKEINDNLEKEIKSYNALYKENNELKEKLDEAKKILSEVKNELGDEPDISDLEKERANLEDEISNKIRPNIDKNLNDIKEFLKRNLVLLYSLPRLRRMYDLIKEKEENNELPPKYDIEELNKMLTEHHCFVCDRELDTHGTIHIAELLKRYELGQQTGVLLTRILGTIESQIREVSKYEATRDNLFQLKKNYKDDLDKALKRVKELDGIIDKYTDKEHIINLYHKRSELNEYINKTEKQVIINDHEEEKFSKRIEELKNELSLALDKDTKNKELNNQAKFAEKAKNKVDEIIIKVKNDIREKISTEMSNKFFELMWKKKFQKVEINEKYVASVINDDGFEHLGSCSAAEKELLALSFTLALHKESGFDGPLVIDTPIARISGDLRVSFAKVLKSVSEYKQIILFVTNDEYSTNVRDIFEPIANTKYKLNLIEEDYVEVGDL